MYSIASTYTAYVTRTMAVFAAVTALSVFLYGIFLLEAVGNTAERTGVERHVRNLTSKVGALESQYLLKTKEMTLERASALGFVAPATVTTVFATAASKSLGINTVGTGLGTDR